MSVESELQEAQGSGHLITGGLVFHLLSKDFGMDMCLKSIGVVLFLP